MPGKELEVRVVWGGVVWGGNRLEMQGKGQEVRVTSFRRKLPVFFKLMMNSFFGKTMEHSLVLYYYPKLIFGESVVQK